MRGASARSPVLSAAAGRTPAAAPRPLAARPPGSHRSRHTDQAHAATSHADRRPAPTSNQDAPAARPACARSDAATISAPTWQTASPTTAASTSSASSAPAGRSTQQSEPAAPQPSNEAPRSRRQAPDRTDADHRAPHHDQQLDAQISQPRRRPDQLHSPMVRIRNWVVKGVRSDRSVLSGFLCPGRPRGPSISPSGTRPSAW